MSYSIIIPSRNPANLEACIKAIRASGHVGQIVVYDDCDTALDFYAEPDGWPAGVSVYREHQRRPFCFARAINEALRVTQDDDVVIMNDDALITTFDPEWYDGCGLNSLEWAANASPEFGIVSAAVIGPSKTPLHAPRKYPFMKEVEPMWNLQSIREVKPMVPFICVYIPRSTIDRVGLLDERFTDYGGEDDDYCYRVRRAGLKIGVYDGCVVDHGTLRSTFRPDGKGRDVSAARQTFREIHGFEMGTR